MRFIIFFAKQFTKYYTPDAKSRLQYRDDPVHEEDSTEYFADVSRIGNAQRWRNDQSYGQVATERCQTVLQKWYDELLIMRQVYTITLPRTDAISESSYKVLMELIELIEWKFESVYTWSYSSSALLSFCWQGVMECKLCN